MKYRYGKNLSNGIYDSKFLHKKKVLILVPHEDDELITVGLILPILKNNMCDITVVYSTNGDYQGIEVGKKRLKEALDYTVAVGIKKENIIFMGFGDYGENSPHLYNCSGISCSPAGNTATYALDSHCTYSMCKNEKEAEYTRENFKQILKDIMREKKSDIIFSIDCDMHSDHIALSLMVEEVLSELIKEEYYRPTLYKAFAHDFLWMGIEDFYLLYLKECKTMEKNPRHTYADHFLKAYYPWENRVRFPVYGDYLSYFAFHNQFRSLMKKYASQYVKYHFPRIMNSDQVFFKRRTDNIILIAEIEASSGDTSCFHTMKMFDCEDVRKKNNLLEESGLFWRPECDDEKRWLKFYFDVQNVSEVVIYTGFHSDSQYSVQIHIGDIEKKVELLPYGQPTRVCLEKSVSCKELYLQFEDSNIEIIKVEAFENKDEHLNYIKIMTQDNFIYRYITTGYRMPQLQLYINKNNTSSIVTGSDKDFCWYETSGDKEKIADIDQFVLRKKKTHIRVENVGNNNIFDEIEIVNVGMLDKIIIVLFGKIEYWINKVCYKIIKCFD